MQSPNLVAGGGVIKCNETTSPNHAPGTSRASTAWWSGPTVNDPLDQRFPGDFPFSPEFLAMQNSGHQYHVNDDTAFRNISENSLLSRSETTNDRTFCYPQDPQRPPPQDDNLTPAYICQWGQPLWYNPFTASLQAMTSQPSTEPLPVIIPPQEQSAFLECAWTEDGKRCGHPILDNRRKLGMHLRDSHGVQGNDKNELVCFWQGCSRKMQRGAIGRHIISCHLKTRFTCKNCLKAYSRSDAMKKHAKDCQAA
ncbi:hypothetical protein BDR05DRAFT_351671 [Suillus weaverae]|nr:hypothetical protein BDR05DRAFT_351671 [Suillus weaverae]